jgi:acyl carrier protein
MGINMGSLESIKEKSYGVVLELLPDVSNDELSDDTDLFDMGLDSINAMTLILSLQDTFDIQFDTNEISFENFRTVGDIAELINRKNIT